MANATVQKQDKSLDQVFEEGLNLFHNLGKIDEPTNSPNVQMNVKKAMHLLEDATRLVSVASIFSTNENIDEIPTEHIKFLLLPALLGSLSLKLTTGERKDIIQTAEVYFNDFLERCCDYGLTDYKAKENKHKNQTANKTQMEQIVQSVSTRASKIQRFKEKKELEEQLTVLKENLNNEHVDDEIKRNYFLTLIKTYIYEAVDELQCIDMEKPILDHMDNMSDKEKRRPKIPVKPLKPIIITRDAIQKAVYGAGYPSLPTMTVDEFYTKRVEEGIFPDPSKAPDPNNMSLQAASLAGISLNDDEDEAAQKETLEEADDPDLLNSLRARDEFKDNHRRGWGNRMNRS